MKLNKKRKGSIDVARRIERGNIEINEIKSCKIQEPRCGEEVSRRGGGDLFDVKTMAMYCGRTTTRKKSIPQCGDCIKRKIKRNKLAFFT